MTYNILVFLDKGFILKINGNKDIIIDFENIYVNYGMTTVLKNINLKIKNDENWVILGANGSGKSTLMKLFSHDIYPNTKYSFKKEIFGKDRWDIFELKKYLGIITNDLQTKFENNAKSETAIDVVLSGYYSSLGVYRHHNFSDEEMQNALQTMDFLNITDIKDKKVCEMSTGQLRRCIIGRSLIHNPKAFILDEPTTGLDIKAQRNVINVLQKLSNKLPVILVTHSLDEIFPQITHTALMYKNTIYKQGKKEDIITSKNLSEIFDTDIQLEFNNGKYSIKN